MTAYISFFLCLQHGYLCGLFPVLWLHQLTSNRHTVDLWFSETWLSDTYADQSQSGTDWDNFVDFCVGSTL